MRAELDAVLFYLIYISERKDLKTAAVRQDRVIPAHKAVQPARLFDDILSGTHMEMIGIAEDYLRAQPLQLGRRHRLDGGLRPHRHKDRRLYHSVRRRKLPGARACLRTLRRQLIFKHLIYLPHLNNLSPFSLTACANSSSGSPMSIERYS